MSGSLNNSLFSSTSVSSGTGGTQVNASLFNGSVAQKTGVPGSSPAMSITTGPFQGSKLTTQLGIDLATAITNAINAANTATSAANNATTLANDASSTAKSAVDGINADAAAASNSASAAATSATDASNSASAAASSSSSAGTSATDAANSASAASTSETNAANSASAAATSATNASNSAGSASTSASDAATSATNASSSASAASTSAANAASSASSASTSETNASNSASAAGTSATDAASSATLAQSWAAQTSGNVNGTAYASAYQYAAQASASESNAATSATAAATSASNSSSSASAAATSASAASTSATNAANSASAAATSATNAASSAATAQSAANTIPAPSASNELTMIRVNSGGSGYESRTPAQILSDIGAQAALGFVPSETGNLANTDLNTATTSGMYRVNVPSANGPGPSYGQLLVVFGTNSDTITQIYGDYTSGTLYTRSASGIGGTPAWTPWRVVIDALNIAGNIPNTAGAIGTYGFFNSTSGDGQVQPGNTVAGSTLKWDNAADGGTTTASAPSGTWQAMGYSNGSGTNGNARTTLFMRIA